MNKMSNDVRPDDVWIVWMDALAEQDFVIIDDFITEALYRSIRGFFRKMEADDKLQKAGIGASGEFQVKSSVRGDFIHWLDRNKDNELSTFFELMDELNQKLRRYCYLSLTDSEFHIAKYPAGSHYNRHLDQFQERSNRQITVLLYLNESWKPGDGGELKIYREDGDILVEPIARRLLLFKSDCVEHEVLTTHVPRYSLTGWLLRQPKSVGYLF
ncbi:2OG-Fe(II) oxygenase [Rhodohalobacter sp. 8-1]|uniref:2OG-Fe(II) oxygenase n=1 Tax=Rhodohalobacter sp. 8-1 TaxID=3131972 RepID=UPI0030EC1295